MEKTNFQIWRDRIAHGGVAFCGTLMSAVPLLASPLALLFLVTREYYQTKIVMIGVLKDQGLWKDKSDDPKFTAVMGMIDWGKDDLVDAYVGTTFGLVVGIIIVWSLI